MRLWQKHHTVADIFPIIVLQWNTGLGPRTRRLKHCLGLPGSYVPVRGNTGWNHSSWPDTIVTICMSYFTTGDPGKEHRTNKTSPTGRIWERSKGDPSPYVLPTSQKSSSLESILAVVCAIRKDADSEWNAKENPKTNPIIIKPKTESHVAKQFSWVPLSSYSTWAPLPNTVSCFISTCVTLDNLFLCVRLEPIHSQALEGVAFPAIWPCDQILAKGAQENW